MRIKAHPACTFSLGDKKNNSRSVGRDPRVHLGFNSPFGDGSHFFSRRLFRSLPLVRLFTSCGRSRNITLPAGAVRAFRSSVPSPPPPRPQSSFACEPGNETHPRPPASGSRSFALRFQTVHPIVKWVSSIRFSPKVKLKKPHDGSSSDVHPAVSHLWALF